MDGAHALVKKLRPCGFNLKGARDELECIFRGGARKLKVTIHKYADTNLSIKFVDRSTQALIYQ